MRFKLAAFFTAACLSFSTGAWAVGQEEASPTGKGIAGGALLGAEVVLVVEAALDVKPAWAYVVGGLAGAAAGGVGGFLVEDSGDPKLSMFLLAGGMALAIPTWVAVLSATAYEPPADYVQDRPPVDEPVADPPPPDASTDRPSGERLARTPLRLMPVRLKAKTGNGAQRTFTRRLAPPALLGVELGPKRDALTVGVPAVQIRGVFTQAERFQFGVAQATEVRMPLFSMVF